MHRAIGLAREARSLFNTQQAAIHPATTRPIYICLSLGPFGASLSPTQEFGGFYPPPYGPRGYSAEGVNSNYYFGDDGKEEKAIEALAAFHLERLLIFAGDKETWSWIDVIAFETVPLAREAIAIRRAMARFEEKNKIKNMDKQWWISFVLPEGRCLQMRGADGGRLTVSELVYASLSPNPLGEAKDKDLRVPDGVGVNCTSVEYLPRLVEEMGRACKEMEVKEWPFLVLYPNGGDEYDTVRREWKTRDREWRGEWVARLTGLVEQALGAGGPGWGGVVVGGCCRSGGGEIAGLVNNM
jgi:homocysteine S-methyltransferase